MAAAYGAQMKWYANMAIALIAAGGQTVDELLPELSFPQLHEHLEDFASFLGGVFGVNDPVGAPWLLGFPETPAPACLVPSWADGAADLWNDAQNTGSPLVLDLAGSGIALTTFNAASTTTFFDIDGDGYAEQTAWIGANMGLLARDLDENGQIDDVGELFGSPSIDGFALLATLDSNGDHVIDQYDSAWGDLVVWVDANGDAVTQDGELQTLVSLDIVSFGSTNRASLVCPTRVALRDGGRRRSVDLDGRRQLEIHAGESLPPGRSPFRSAAHPLLRGHPATPRGGEPAIAA